METNTNIQIALRIAGTKQRRAGFAPLVSVGVLPGNEGDNMYRSPSIVERPAFIVKHTATYILYQLIDRGVRPFDADASGALSIALAISSNAQLDDGKSPHALLTEIYAKFMATYMEPVSDGRFAFRDTDIDTEIFREIVSRYPIAKRTAPYIPMNPQGATGIVCVPQDKMEDFFANTQYKEFVHFKEIEVGVSCGAQVSSGLENLQIPLPLTVFSVFVNGRSTGKLLQQSTDSYYATEASTDFYDFESVEFTLGEVMAAADGQLVKNNARIAVDYTNSRINCTLKKKDIYYGFDINWQDNTGQNAKEKILQATKQGNLRFQLRSEIINSFIVNPSEAQFKASDLIGQKVQVNPVTIDDYSLKVRPEVDKVKRLINITIVINKRAIPSKPVSQVNTRPNSTSPRTTTSNSANTAQQSPTPQSTVPVSNDSHLTINSGGFDMKSLLLGFVGGLIIGGLTTLLFITWYSSPKQSEDNIEEPRDTVIANGKREIEHIANADSMTARGGNDPAIAAGKDKTKVTETKDEGKDVTKTTNDTDVREKEKIAAEKEKQAQQQQDATKAKKEILDLVNNKKTSINTIRNNNGWQFLSTTEKLSVELVYNYESQKTNSGNKLNGKTKQKIKNVLNKKFTSFEDLQATRNEIIRIINSQDMEGEDQ